MGSANLSTKRQRIAELARTKAGTALSTLHHVIDLEWMREAYRLTRKDGASGIDGVTAAQYEANLEANLLALLERIKSGRYVAPPVRRVYIPKADGSERPLGIPTFEDKVAQRAIVMVLEPIYEQEFLPCSFGFRPGRSAHQALSALRLAFMGRQGLRWVLDVDMGSRFRPGDLALTRLALPSADSSPFPGQRHDMQADGIWSATTLVSTPSQRRVQRYARSPGGAPSPGALVISVTPVTWVTPNWE